MEALLFILFIVLAIAGNKGRADAKKRRQQARRAQPPAYAPPPTATDALPGAAFDWPVEGAAYEAAPVSGSLAYDSSEGRGSNSSAGGVSLEGLRASQEGEGSLPSETRFTAITHVVRPFTEGDHRHVESSLTGDMPCPRVSGFPGGAPPHAAHQTAASGLRLDLAGVRQGLIYAEILGKPRALQGRARR
ncbi:MAG: hypothetical protein VB051_07075 [Candidatus Pelethousia sp.]|nr:hypothetical protein [Candidatus Pelethousia sp.]